MMFALVYLHFEVNFCTFKSFGFSNKRRRWNGATSFGPCYLLLTLAIRFCLEIIIYMVNLSKRWDFYYFWSHKITSLLGKLFLKFSFYFAFTCPLPSMSLSMLRFFFEGSKPRVDQEWQHWITSKQYHFIWR